MICGNKGSSPSHAKQHSRADGRLSDILNYKHKAVTPPKQQGQDWSEDVEPNEQSQQAAKKKKTVVL